MSTFCPYFKQGLFIGSTADGEPSLAMCCWQKKKTVDRADFDHSYLEQTRAESLTQLPEVCSPYCAVPGHVANDRERSLVEWPLLFGPITEEKVIRVLHIEQSLICNLKCISCSSRLSSAWNGEYQLFDPTAPTVSLAKFPEEQWRNLDLTHLQRIHFTGGEPLLNRDNKKLLQHLKELGVLSNVILSYSTNGTIIPDNETLELWRQSRFVRLFISLDGTESVFEYTRYPAKWAEVTANIEHFRSLKDICILIEVNAIVGMHNIFALPKFFAWWQEHCPTGSQGDPSHVFVRRIQDSTFGGTALDLQHLTEEQANRALDMLYLLNYPGILDIINYIKQNRNPSTAWVDYLERLDNIRGTNWQDSLPQEITC